MRLITFLICSFAGALYAQNTFIFSYNNVAIGRNLTLGVEKKSKRHSFFIAAKGHINNRQTDNQNYLFRKRFFAIDRIETFLGAELYYRYDLKKSAQIVFPYYFTDIQISHIHTRNRKYVTTGYTVFPFDTYFERIGFYGPFTPVELNTGFGLEIIINERFSWHQKLGAGINLIFGKDKDYPPTASTSFRSEFSWMFSFGIGYKLKKKD